MPAWVEYSRTVESLEIASLPSDSSTAELERRPRSRCYNTQRLSLDCELCGKEARVLALQMKGNGRGARQIKRFGLEMPGPSACVQLIKHESPAAAQEGSPIHVRED